jgi:hypothetical protein
VSISCLTLDHHRSRRSISRPARAVGAPPAQDALVLLCPDHPLARAEVRLAALGVAAIEATLLTRLAFVAGDRCGAARDLIAAGRADLPVAAVGRELRPGSRSSASRNRVLPRTFLAFAVAAIVAATCAPAASASTAHDPGSACHTFQRFHEIWRLCPDADGALQRQRIGVLP